MVCAALKSSLTEQQVTLQCHKMRLHHSALVISLENVKLHDVVYLFGYVKVHCELFALVKSLTVWSLTSTMPEFCNDLKITKMQFSYST